MKTQRLIVGGISLLLFAGRHSDDSSIAVLGCDRSRRVEIGNIPMPGSLDDQLLKGLDNPLLDDLHDKPNAKLKPSPPPIAAEKSAVKTSPKPSPSTAPSHEKPADTSESAESRPEGRSSTVDPLDESLRNSRTTTRQRRRHWQAGGRFQSADQDQHQDAFGGRAAGPTTFRRADPAAATTDRRRVRVVGQATRPAATATTGCCRWLAANRFGPQPKSGNSPATHRAIRPALTPISRLTTVPRALNKPRVDRPDPAASRRLVEKAIDRLNLPAKDREEMLQAPPDEFLPGYEAVTKRYFERIVEGDSNNLQVPDLPRR